jgi:hypothetical protein
MSVMESIQFLNEAGRWNARSVKYWKSKWDKLKKEVPTFEIQDFRVGKDGPANPYLKSVVRQPKTLFEKQIPVAVVSNSYMLAQHVDVAEKCLEGIRLAGVEPDNLECELGLTELGEFMDLRIYFPDRFIHTGKDGYKIQLRLECFNSVDRSSRLVILLGWLRQVCTNGMVIGETRTDIRDIHNENLDLNRIPEIVGKAMKAVNNDVLRLKKWEEIEFPASSFANWINGPLAEHWGKKAACRVYHICMSGYDVEFENPFAPGEATDKPVKKSKRIPGSPERAQNLYDLSQVLSWVATNRMDSEERLNWQTAIPVIMKTIIAA